MLSLIILVVAGAYVGLWYLLIRALPNRWAKAIVALVALYLPFWDVPYGYYNFRALCSEEGELHVLRKVSPQTSIFLDQSLPLTEKEIARMLAKGFRVVEVRRRDGSMVSLRKDESGGIHQARLDQDGPPPAPST